MVSPCLSRETVVDERVRLHVGGVGAIHLVVLGGIEILSVGVVVARFGVAGCFTLVLNDGRRIEIDCFTSCGIGNGGSRQCGICAQHPHIAAEVRHLGLCVVLSVDGSERVLCVGELSSSEVEACGGVSVVVQ